MYAKQCYTHGFVQIADTAEEADDVRLCPIGGWSAHDGSIRVLMNRVYRVTPTNFVPVHPFNMGDA
jgi:hypothetical protein